MQLQFQKMRGAGNEILIVDQRVAAPLTPDPAVLDALRHATRDSRFDQLMWLNRPKGSDAAASYRVFNVDGSEVEQCGNGVRCVAALLAGEQQTIPAALKLEGPTGVVAARVISPTHAAVEMGVPAFDDRLSELTVNGASVPVQLVSMGNPHCVLDVADVEAADVATLGPAIESHAEFPQRINVGFMQILDRYNIKLRVYERGAGETLACGTGACAAVASGRHRDLLGDDVTVQMRGGELVVSWLGADASMWLSGDVTFISEGKIDL